MNFKLKMIITIIIIFFSSCYQEKNRQYLFISFYNSRLSGKYLKNYIDNVRDKNIIVPDSIKDIFLFGDTIDNRQRFVYFKSSPEEWYMILFYTQPCLIENIYNKTLSNHVINDRSVLGDKEIERIQLRFRNEILIPAEQYGKLHHVPDTVMYRK